MDAGSGKSCDAKSCVEDRVADGAPRATRRDRFEPAADVVAQLVDRLISGNGAGEIVVDRRQLELFDFVQRDREARRPCRPVPPLGTRRESGLDRLGLARLHAGDSRREARDEAALSELRDLARAAAAFERLAVDRAVVVERHDVAELRRRVRRGTSVARSLASASRLRVDVGVGDVDGRPRHRDALVRAQRDRRPNFDRRFDAAWGGRSALFEDSIFGALDRLEVVLADRLGIDFRDDFFDGVGWSRRRCRRSARRSCAAPYPSGSRAGARSLTSGERRAPRPRQARFAHREFERPPGSGRVGSMSRFSHNKRLAEDEIRTRDPRLGKAMLYH